MTSLSGYERLLLDNDCLGVSFLPALGGKMVSLKRAGGGREFLLQPMRPYRSPRYGANFEDYDTSGFDECFPSVSACQYPGAGGSGAAVPDHGDLWSVPWEYEFQNKDLLLWVSGRCFPYVFRKRVRLRDNAVVFDYEVESKSTEPFRFLWSAHPLLAVTPGCSIILPSEVKETFINWSQGERLGRFGDTCGWPVASISAWNKANLAQLSSIEAKTADKLFTPRLTQGKCAVYYPTSDESLTFQFDASVTPYLGVWICQGGWPSPEGGHFTLALEPCSGRPDSLAEAFARQECQVLAPGATQRWRLMIQVQKGYPPI